jgi:hypothetical protein
VVNDFAGRTLRAAVRVLPERRRDWGRAMLAELASMDDVRARRRFAVSCVRATITGRATADLVVVGAAAVGVGSFAQGIESPGVRVETMVFVGVLAALSWAGRRASLRAPSRIGRGIRLAVFLLVGGCELLLLSSSGGGAARDPGGWWFAELTMILAVTGVLALTARRAHVPARDLRHTAVLTGAGAGLWLVLLLVSGGARTFPLLALIIVAVVMALAARGRPQAAVRCLGAGTVTCLLIFLVSVSVYRIFPDLVPDITGAGGGLTAAARAETSRIESTDPYVMELVLAGLLGAALAAAVRRAGPVVR